MQSQNGIRIPTYIAFWLEKKKKKKKKIFKIKMHLSDFDLAVTLIRTFRLSIHPGAVCYIPKNISSMDAKH